MTTRRRPDRAGDRLDLATRCRRYSTYLGGQFLSGFFCWIMHEQLGRATCASADGRHAPGFPLGDGSGPAQGRERLGPTAALLSATRWDHTPHLGGIAVNLKFSRRTGAAAEEAFVPRLLDLAETYLRRGGFEVQVNVVDRATLLAARERPGNTATWWCASAATAITLSAFRAKCRMRL